MVASRISVPALLSIDHKHTLLEVPSKPRYRPTPRPCHRQGQSGCQAPRRIRQPGRVVATTDPSALLGGDADVVASAAAANLRPLEAVNDMVSILCAGKNVLSCWVVPLVYPDAVDPAFTDPLREAALAGGVSFFTTGIDSGFANDVLPLALSGVARTIDSIRVTEMFNYATYPDATALYDILGFGKAPEELPFAARPGVFTFGWGPVLHQLADGLATNALHVDRVRRQRPDLRPRPRQPHARRHRTGLAPATHLDPAA